MLLMHSSNRRQTANQIGREILLKDAEMLSWRTQRSHQPIDYEMPSSRADNNSHRFEADLSSERNSRSNLHSSSSSRHFRPSSSPKEKLESNLNNRQETQERPSTQMSSWWMYSPRKSQQRRSSIGLPIRAHSHLEDSADELSPRQPPGKSSLSRYKPLPAIGAKNQETSSANILQTTSDYQNEDKLTNEQNCSSPNTIRSLTAGLTKRSLRDNDLSLISPSLDLKKTSTKPRQSLENTEEPLSQSGSPQNPTTINQEISVDLIDRSVEPSLEEARTLLAVKLPSGQRIQRFFRLTDPLRLVRRFAEISSKKDFTDFQLVKSFPREILDLEQTLEENNLLEKTLLHLENSLPS